MASDPNNKFLEKISNLQFKVNHHNVMNRSEFCALVEEVEKAYTTKQKSSKQYRLQNKYEIEEIGQVKVLLSKTDKKIVLAAEEMYEIIESAHKAIGHGGRDRLREELKKKYANITLEIIAIFLAMCDTCQLKKNKKKKGLVTKPIVHFEMNSRCQVDLIDMQSEADQEFKFIMVYQDHLTKFVLLRPLQSKKAKEVADHLLDIFLIFGAPCILHSDNGKEFVNSIIDELKLNWAELKIVHGKPRHSQSQGSVERANQDVEKMLASWMKDNTTTHWAKGLRFVQFMKNRALHSGIKQSPYKAMFGIEPRVGLTSTMLPPHLIKQLKDEDDLHEIVSQRNEKVNPIASISGTNIKEARKLAHEGLQKQAMKMLTVSNASLPKVTVGTNVLIKIPEVDRSKTELPNLMGVILEEKEEELFRIGTISGILDKLYCRLVFLSLNFKILTKFKIF